MDVAMDSVTRGRPASCHSAETVNPDPRQQLQAAMLVPTAFCASPARSERLPHLLRADRPIVVHTLSSNT